MLCNLENNYGYTEKRQVELGERASRAVSAAGMTMEERQELLQEIAREFASDGSGE